MAAAELVRILREGQKDVGDINVFKKALKQCDAAELNRLGNEDEPNKGMTCLHVICSQGFVRHCQAVIDRA